MLSWIKSVLSSESCASFARCATGVTVAIGCGNLIYLVHRNSALPDAPSLVALGIWMTSPYAINKATAAWGKCDDPGHRSDTLP